MPNLPISGLTASATNLGAADVLPVTQTTGVGPVKMTGLQIAGGLLGSTSLTGATVTTSQPVLNLAQTWNAGAVTFTGLRFNAAGASDANSAAASLLMDLQVGGSSLFAVRKDNSILFSGGGNNGRLFTTGGILSYSAAAADFAVNGADNVRRASIGANGVRLISGAVVDWSSNANGPATANVDLILRRRGAANLQLGAADAAAPVAQTLSVQSVVGGTSNTAGADFTLDGSQSTGNAQGGRFVFRASIAGSSGTSQNSLSRIADLGSMAVTGGGTGRFFTVYDTFTDTSNYSRVRMGYSTGSGSFEFVSENVGTGTVRALTFNVFGAQNIYFGTQNITRLFIDYNGNLGAGAFTGVNDNTFDWGKTVYGNNRPRDLYVGRNFFLGAYQEMTEMTAPAAPAANSVRIYAVDNGSGKTQLMALFATGAAQQIAIEP